MILQRFRSYIERSPLLSSAKTFFHTDPEVERIHKGTVKGIVAKLVSTYAGFMIITGFELTWKWGLSLVISSLTVLLNNILDDKIIKFKFGNHETKMSLDFSDALRWFCNILLVDTPLCFLLGFTSISMAGFWAIVMIAVFVEVYSWRYRFFLLLLGLTASSICFATITGPVKLNELIFWNLNLLCVLGFFVSMEKYWTQATKAQLNSISQSEKLKMDAMLGAQARHISHELNNMIMVVDASVQSLRRTIPEADLVIQSRISQLERATTYIRKITHLVMDTARYRSDKRIQTFGDLLDDVNLLIRKIIENKGIVWQLEVPSQLTDLRFEERSGSTYLIIHNIVKNAAEALADSGRMPQGRVGSIRLSIEHNPFISAGMPHGSVILAIIDNGPGLDQDNLQKILNQVETSSKVGGHGLGLKFVQSECLKNNFKFSGTSEKNGGCRFEVHIPLMQPDQPIETLTTKTTSTN